MRNRRAAVIFILVTVTLDILAMGLIIPVLPKLILDFLGGRMTDAATWSGRFAVVFALMQFFFSPLLGVLSDKFGRRPVILLSNLGLGLDYIVMAMAPTLYWLFLGRVISGITTSSIPTAMAYIADVTPKEKRAGAFGMIGVAFGIGFILGPGLGGLLGKGDPRLAFWVAAGLSLANWLWGFFFVPESLPPEKRQEFALRRANPVGSLKLLRSHHELWRLATIQFLAYLAHNIFSVWALYGMYRYAWNTDDTGYSLVFVGIVTAIISGGLTGRMVKRFGEKMTLYIGQFFGASGMFVAGIAKTSALFVASIPIISLWNISMPAAQGMMTHRVSEREQGELQGALQSMRSITFILGPWMFLKIFGWSIDPKHALNLPGAPFYVAAALLFTAMLMSTRIKEDAPAASRSTAGPAPPDVVPPEGMPSGPIAPIMDQKKTFEELGSVGD
jgi:DHA1 family tetracycline resistance protein-like MFS transporter